MPTTARSGLIAASLSLLGGCATQPAQAPVAATQAANRPAITHQRGALPGKRQQVAFLTAANPDCSPVGITPDLTFRPEHGTVEFVSLNDFGEWPSSNPRSKCNDRRVPGTGVFYTSDPGFRGTDTFVVTWVTAGGFRNTWSIAVNVQ